LGLLSSVTALGFPSIREPGTYLITIPKHVITMPKHVITIPKWLIMIPKRLITIGRNQ